jgi:hypothetical protein
MERLFMSDKPVFTAEQIGEVEAMYIAAMRGLSLKDVGVKETDENIDDFNKLKAEVKQILGDENGLATI